MRSSSGGRPRSPQPGRAAGWEKSRSSLRFHGGPPSTGCGGSRGARAAACRRHGPRPSHGGSGSGSGKREGGRTVRPPVQQRTHRDIPHAGRPADPHRVPRHRLPAAERGRSLSRAPPHRSACRRGSSPQPAANRLPSACCGTPKPQSAAVGSSPQHAAAPPKPAATTLTHHRQIRRFPHRSGFAPSPGRYRRSSGCLSNSTHDAHTGCLSDSTHGAHSRPHRHAQSKGPL